MSQATVAAYEKYIQALHLNGETRDEIVNRLKEKLAEEPDLHEDEAKHLLAHVDACAAATATTMRDVEEIRVASDLDGIRQTLRDHARFLPACLVAIGGLIVLALLLGYMHGTSGRILVILWFCPVLLVTFLVTKAGRCVDGPIKGINAIAAFLGFLLYIGTMQAVFEARVAGRDLSSYGAVDFLVFSIGAWLSVGPMGLVVLVAGTVWAFKFPVISIGPDEIARARKLLEAAPTGYSGHSRSDSPY